MTLTRRDFLRAAGITLAAAQLPLPQFQPSIPSFDAVYGRALGAVSVYAAPHLDAPLAARLWSDTVVQILETDVAWYRLKNGYVSRTALQPMVMPARASSAPVVPPFWGEVTGAVAVVRAFCAVDAPIITRVGHGGVLRVIDYLPGEGDWYGVAEGEDSDLLGWTRATSWSPAQIDQLSPTLTVSIDTSTQQIEVSDWFRTLLTAPITAGNDVPSGVYPITGRKIAIKQQNDHFGAPWAITFGEGYHLTGAYWHNRFGTAAAGAAVEVTPKLARWLFPRAAKVIIS